MGLLGGEVGLAITQAVSLTGFVQWGIRQSAEITNQLMSVERVLEYKVLPKEKEPDIPNKPSQTWPDKGLIRFDNMGLKYVEDGPLVLKDLDLEIAPNEKVRDTHFSALLKTINLYRNLRRIFISGWCRRKNWSWEIVSYLCLIQTCQRRRSYQNRRYQHERYFST